MLGLGSIGLGVALQLMIVANEVSGFAHHYRGLTSSLERKSCVRCQASFHNIGIGQTNSDPLTVSAYNKKEFSLSASLAVAALILPQIAKATAPAALGVDQDGFFELCTDSVWDGCVSSQDDRPACFLAPWEYEGSYMNAKKKLLAYLNSISGIKILSGGDVADKEILDFKKTEENISRYVRAEIVDKKTSAEDDIEFYFTPNDNTIQYRSLRRIGTDIFALENKNRIEKMRLALRFSNIPILRNRRRVLFFVESPFDSFGPPTIMFDKLLDNVSGEMEFKNGVIGVLDPLSPIWETPSTAALKMKNKK